VSEYPDRAIERRVVTRRDPGRGDGDIYERDARVDVYERARTP